MLFSHRDWDEQRHSGPCDHAEKQIGTVRSAHMPDPLGLGGRWRAPHPPEGPGTAFKPAVKMPDFLWKFITLKQSRLHWSKEARKRVNAMRERKAGPETQMPRACQGAFKSGTARLDSGCPLPVGG